MRDYLIGGALGFLLWIGLLVGIVAVLACLTLISEMARS